MKALSTCNLHFRAGLTEPEFEIYLRGLEVYESYRVKEALGRCERECAWMPKLKDIMDRMPSKRAQNQMREGIIAREWDEPFSAQSVVHYIEFEDGDRFVQFRPRPKN